MTSKDFSEEEIKTIKTLIQFFEISDVGCYVKDEPLIDETKIQYEFMCELRLLIQAYFTPSGQKGLNLGEARQVIKTLTSQYPSRGYIYLAFLLEDYKIQKTKNCPAICCKMIDLKDFQQRMVHLSKMGEIMRHYKFQSE